MVLLPWTPPYDWAWMVGFLQARAVAGVERFDEGGYSRSFGVEGHRGLIHLAPDEEAQGLRVTLSPGLQPVAEICYARIGQLFDLACDPRQVARTLGGENRWRRRPAMCYFRRQRRCPGPTRRR